MPGEAPKWWHTLEKGAKYRFVYQIPGLHRKPREGVAVFIDLDMVPGARGVNLDFSGRPEFGTTTLKSEWIKSLERASATAKPYMDKVVK